MKTEEIETTLKHYAAIFNAAKKLMNDDDYIAATLTAEVGKHLRGSQMAEERQRSFNGNNNGNNSQKSFGNNGDDQPATAKQIAYMQSLRLSIPKNLTKRKAAELIDNAKAH